MIVVPDPTGTTSGITAWPMTAEQIVTHALQEIGAYSGGETPTGEDMEASLDRLNAMLQSWEGEGAMFRDATDIVVAGGGSGQADAPDNCRDIYAVRQVMSSTYNRQLGEWNRSQFYTLPNRNAVGNPTVYYVSRTTGTMTINVWPVPADDIDLEVDYGKSAEVVTDRSETVDVPQDWQEALILGLASRCASMFGATRIDPASVQRIDQKAAVLYQRLMDRDRPNSYYFEPDY